MSVTREALRRDPEDVDPNLHLMLELGLVFERAHQFDVIHSHVDYFALPMARLVKTPVVTTLHGRLDLPGLRTIYGRYNTAPLVSISDNQRDPLPGVNWAATVYNGTDLASFTFNEKGGECFVFVGRICPEKNIEGAIAIARRTGVPLRIAAKVDPVDVDYHESVIKPLIDGRQVEYLGEVGDTEKDELLGSASRTALPRGLARAVRLGDDGGDGMWHARPGPASGIGTRSGRGRRHRLRARTPRKTWPSWPSRSAASPDAPAESE